MITELTPEQEALLPVYRDRYIALGLATGPCDRAAVEAGCREAYNQAGLTYPPDGRFVSGANGRMFVDNPDHIPKDDEGRPLFDGAVGIEIPNCVTDGPGRIYWTDGPVEGRRKARELDPSSDWRASYGSHEASWLSFHGFMGEVLGVKGPEKLSGLQKMLGCGWWWAYDEAVVFSELATEIHLDERGRLSRTDGPAVAYPDGSQLFSIHGVDVDKSLVLEPLTLAAIQGQTNAEVRRTLITLFGEERFLSELGAKPVAEDDIGRLYRYTLDGDAEPTVLVRVVNSTPEPDGTSKVYFFRINPELRPHLGEEELGEPQELTPRNAVAALYGMTGDKYYPVVET